VTASVLLFLFSFPPLFYPLPFFPPPPRFPPLCSRFFPFPSPSALAVTKLVFSRLERMMNLLFTPLFLNCLGGGWFSSQPPNRAPPPGNVVPALFHHPFSLSDPDNSGRVSVSFAFGYPVRSASPRVCVLRYTPPAWFCPHLFPFLWLLIPGVHHA